MSGQKRIVYLMRGLPSCGKSRTAAKLARPGGVVLETDQYFYHQVGDDPASYDYDSDLLSTAREWNFERFKCAVKAGDSPIVVDRGNGRNAETKQYLDHAVANGYDVQLAEPESEWWQEIRVLLKYKQLTGPALDMWAEKLAAMSRDGHRVPASTIRRWMEHWKWDLTVDEIAAYRDGA